jgi:hypothetical protein
MVNAGMAQWKAVEDGTIKFIWNTQEVLLASLEEVGSAVKKWISPYDRLFNLNEALNGTIREREKLERKYNRALAENNLTAQEMADSLAEQMLLLN